MGHLTNLTQAFYGNLFNNVKPIYPRVQFMTQLTDNQTGSVLYVNYTHNWIKRYMKHNHFRPNSKFGLLKYLK